MLAELYYPAGTNISNMLTDIASVLSGVTDKSLLSSGLDKAISSVVADKKQSNWELITTVNYGVSGAQTDILSTGSVVTIGGARIMRQPCTTAPGKYKYLKFGFLTHSGYTTTLAVNVGKGSSGNLLTGYHNTYYYSGDNHFTRSSTSVQTSANAVKLIVYGSATAVLVNLAEGDLFTPALVFAAFEMEKNWYQFDGSDAIPFLLSQGSSATANDTAARGSSQLEMIVTPPMSIDGTVWGDHLNGVHYGRMCRFGLCTPEIRFTRDMYSTGVNKFTGFKPNGTQYDMFNFGTNFNDCRQYGISGDPNFPPSRQEMFPYSSITEVTGVYLIHKEAFGKNGAYYQTPVGTMCKFGTYMVEVG